nr:glycoside hydrolase family 9 protein [Spirochaetaceae bacterium]
VQNGTEKWGLFVNDPGVAEFYAVDGHIEYQVEDVGEENWHIQGQYAGLSMIEGGEYILTVDMRSTIPRTAQIRIQKDSDPYTGYMEEFITLSQEMQTYRFEFTMEDKSDPLSKLCFNLGYFEEDAPMEAHIVEVDNLSLMAMNGQTIEEEKVTIVHVNQLGYLPQEEKIVMTKALAGTCEVINMESGESVFQGDLTGPVDDAASGDRVYAGDFSDFTTPGEYTIEINGEESSYVFTIGKNIYAPLQLALQKFFYYQRCGEALGVEYGGLWSHEACHSDRAIILETQETLSVTGGWHDAGDYGRYVVPAAKAVADLIMARQFYPQATASDALGIPESENANADLDDQIRFELDWMLQMQDAETGGVYHKITTARFQGVKMPQDLHDDMIISPISAAATGDFAAVMALSARVYGEMDPSYAEKALSAAKKAWMWLEEHPQAPGFTNPQEIQTGEYGDGEMGDERFWAATELFLTTGEPGYHEYLQTSYQNNSWSGLGWASVGDYALISYIFTQRDDKNNDFQALLEQALLNKASELSQAATTDGYNISMGVNYPWGSNMTVANNGVLLLVAYEIGGNEMYRTQALDHIHYLLGRNALSQSYVTSFGTKSTKDPHHRPSTAIGEVVPGMVAGGPNMNLQDSVAKSLLSGNPPSRCYIDAEPSYSTNEITIYWNSPAYWLVSAFVE